MRTIKFAIIFCLFLANFSFCVFARESFVDEQLDSSGIDELYDSLDDETKELLDAIEIDEADFNDILNITPKTFFSAVTGVFNDNIGEIAGLFARMVGIIILAASASAFIKDGDKSGEIVNLISGLLLIMCIAVPLSDIVASAVGSVKLTGAFTLSLIPVLAAVIAASGNAVLAVCYNSAAFAASQGMSGIISSFITPCSSMLIGIGIVDSIAPALKFGKVSAFAKKTATWVFGTAATLFTALLSLKGVLASSADTIATKGIKIAAGSFIPVVGSQLGEAYTSVIGSIAVVRSTIGVFGIIALALINLPVIARVVLWIAALRIANIIAEMFDVKGASAFLKTAADAVSLLNICVFFNAVSSIISTALMLLIKADL